MTGRAPLIAALALGLALGGCASPLPVATAADAARAQQRWPDATVAELNHGRTVVLRRCSGCHQPPTPGERTAAQWPAQVAAMAARSGLRTSEREPLGRYLATFARDQVVAPR